LATKPDVIYAPVTSHIIPLFRQIRQLGFTGTIITSDNLTEDLIGQDKGVFEGTFQTMVSDPHNSESESLARLYRARFNKEPKMLAFHSWGYDGVRLMAEALRRSDLRRESIRNTLLSIRDFPGAGGTITFSPEGSWRMPLGVFEVKDGKFSEALKFPRADVPVLP
jgi:ABC-type branched-subunit amino acid transport system substrate-binding protein